MRAYQVQSPDGIDALKQIELPTPPLKSTDVLVEMKAASVNYRDLGITRGGYLRNDTCPVIPLSDGSGEVIDVGSEVSQFQVGDRVIGAFVQDWIDGSPTDQTLRTSLGGGIDGVLCQQKLFPQHGLVKIPNALTYEQAATLPCAAVTAWHALFATGQLQPKQTVLTLGTGGVSIFALLLAKAAGAEVLITSSSQEKLERAQQLGADHLVNYSEQPDWHKTVQEITSGAGVDHIVEVGGPGTLEKSLKCIGVGGQVSLIGVLNGTEGLVNPISTLFNVSRIQGIYVGSIQMLKDLLNFVDTHDIKPIIDQTFSFEEAPAALHHLKSGQHFGKIVITF